METKTDPLHSKLTVIKKMLEEVQDDLDMDYRVEGTLQDIIDMMDEAMIMHSTSTG